MRIEIGGAGRLRRAAALAALAALALAIVADAAGLAPLIREPPRGPATG